MIFKLENDLITVTVAEVGAELVGLKRKSDGTEFIWQGDERYWHGHAPIMFPICGRLTDNKYTYRGEMYEMNLHGFVRKLPFALESRTGDSLTMRFDSSDETRGIYPFDFTLWVTYTLSGAKLSLSARVKSRDDKPMPFAFGFHPGFNVPLGGGAFEDWFVEFPTACEPQRVVFDGCFFSDKTQPFALEDGRRMHLTHDLFDLDAVFLKGCPRSVTLRSEKSAHAVTVGYPDMQYVGFWHADHTDAPYVCIEPWQSMPAYFGKVDDLETKRDMNILEAGAEYTTGIEIEVR